MMACFKFRSIFCDVQAENYFVNALILFIRARQKAWMRQPNFSTTV